MATLVLNVSGGNLHLDSLGVALPPGGRKEFDCTESELLVLCPELSQFKLRMRVMVCEDAVVVSEEPKKTLAPVKVEPVKPAPAAPAPVVANPAVKESEDEDA